jgi:hypothetical protein
MPQPTSRRRLPDGRVEGLDRLTQSWLAQRIRFFQPSYVGVCVNHASPSKISSCRLWYLDRHSPIRCADGARHRHSAGMRLNRRRDIEAVQWRHAERRLHHAPHPWELPQPISQCIAQRHCDQRDEAKLRQCRHRPL